MARIQIIGGSFQDVQGNLLDHGNLTLQLNQDAQTNDSEITAGLIANIPLDKSGDVMGTNKVLVSTIQTVAATSILTVTSPTNMNNLISVGDKVVFPTGMTANFLNNQIVTVKTIATNGLSFTANFFNADYGPTAESGISFTIGVAVFVWPNDQLNPSNSYYIMDGYTQIGQFAWGPFYGGIFGPTPFDMGTLVPVGDGGAPIGSILLQTNSVNNDDQAKLNIISGDASITFTNSAGTTDARVNGTPILFQTNSVDNSDQVKLNLISSDSSVSLINTSGTTDIKALGSSFGLALPSWWTTVDGTNYAFTTAVGLFGSGTANVIKFWMFRVWYEIVVYRATWRYVGAGAGGLGAHGIYSADGQTLLSSWDNFSFTGGAGAKSTLNTQGAPVILTPGIYLHASGQSLTGAGAQTQGGVLTQGTSDITNSYNAASTIRSGVGANALASGFMPSALGTLSLSVNVQVTMPHITFEPS